MDTGQARAAGTAIKVQEAGENIGHMFEISTVRREDWDFKSDKRGEIKKTIKYEKIRKHLGGPPNPYISRFVLI